MFTWCLVIAVLLAQAPAPSKNAQATFSMSISTGQDIMSNKSDIALNILITNTSSSDIRLRKANGRSSGEILNDIEVRDRKGDLAPETKYMRIVKREDTSDGMQYSTQSRFLHPGESMQEQVILNKLYDLSLQGTYTIQVSRKDSYSGLVVRSNALTVDIY